MKKTYKLLLLCLALLLLLCACALTPQATVFLEPLATPKDVDLTHELYQEFFLGPTFYAKRLEELNGTYTWSGELEYTYKYFLADAPYEEQNITSAQQAYDYFMSLDREALHIPKTYVVFQIAYDADYDVWLMWTCHEKDFEGNRAHEIVDDGTWIIYFRGNGQLLYRDW